MSQDPAQKQPQQDPSKSSIDYSKKYNKKYQIKKTRRRWPGLILRAEGSGTKERERWRPRILGRGSGILQDPGCPTLLRNECSPDDILSDQEIKALHHARSERKKAEIAKSKDPKRAKTETEVKASKKEAAKKEQARIRLREVLAIQQSIPHLIPMQWVSEKFRTFDRRRQVMFLEYCRNSRRLEESGDSGKWRVSKRVLKRVEEMKEFEAKKVNAKPKTIPKGEEDEDTIMDDMSSENDNLTTDHLENNGETKDEEDEDTVMCDIDSEIDDVATDHSENKEDSEEEVRGAVGECRCIVCSKLRAGRITF
jgi:hypothetical protein